MESPNTHVIHSHSYHIAGQIYDCLRTFIYPALRGGDHTQVIIPSTINTPQTLISPTSSMNFINIELRGTK